MNYKEYQKAKEQVITSLNKEFTKKQFDDLERKIKQEKKIEKKIDKIVEEYLKLYLGDIEIKNNYKDINLCSIGYYSILEYCLKKIKMNDKNLMTGFSANIKNKEDNK